MRQIIIIGPLFIILLAIVYFFTPDQPAGVRHEAFIGSDVQAVILQHDLDERLAEFAASPLGQTFADLDYDLVGRELGLTPDLTDRLKGLPETLTNTVNDPLFKTLFGSEVSFSLYPFEALPDIPLEEQILEHVLMVSRPRHSARLFDFAGWFGTTGETMTEASYGAHLIKRFEIEPGRRIGAVRVKDLLVFSFNERLLRRSLDVYDKESPGLLDDQEYAGISAEFADASLFCYTDLAALPAFLEQAIPPTAVVEEIDIGDLSGYRQAYFGAWPLSDSIYDKAIISFDHHGLDGDEDSFSTKQPAIPQAIDRVGSETIWYYWTNGFDIGSLLQLVQNGAGDTAPLDSIAAEISRVTGLTQTEFKGLFGPEFMLALDPIDDDQLIPLPAFVIGIQSNDTETLKEAVIKLVDHYGIPMRRSEAPGAEVFSWGGTIGFGNLLPSVAFTDDSVVISSSRDHVRQFLTQGEGQGGLLQNPDFSQLRDAILQPSNTITYLDSASMAATLKELVSWGGTMLAITDRERARRSKILIDNLIHPVLDGLAMYSTVGSRTYVDGDTLVFEATTILDHEKR